MSNLEYDAIGHRYILDGTEIPGVTRVIGDVLVGGKQWADEAAMWRGSVVHKVCELDDRGTLDEATIDPAAAGYLAAWRKFKAEMQPRFIEVEEAHTDKGSAFAGRPDRVATIGGIKTVIDIKSGAAGVAVAIQLAAYATLTGCTGRMAVCIQADGRYNLQTYSVVDLSRDRSVFLNALAVWNWKKERRLI